MTSEEKQSRIAELLAEELQRPPTWWHLSFASERFLGVTVIKASGMIMAIQRSHQLGINPGGEVMATPLFEVPLDVEPPAELFEHLVTDKKRIDELCEEWMGRVDRSTFD